MTQNDVTPSTLLLFLHRLGALQNKMMVFQPIRVLRRLATWKLSNGSKYELAAAPEAFGVMG